MGKKSDRQDEHDRKHGNAVWAPCIPCKAYGQINKVKCEACNGIGFIPRNATLDVRRET